MSARAISVSFTFASLTTEQAIALWEALTKAADEIWDVYGDAMGEVFAREAHGEEDDDASWAYSLGPDDDVPF